MSAVAESVRVTDAFVAAMVHSTKTRNTLGATEARHAWAMIAAANKSGKMIPPGNLSAQARAMAKSLTRPTCRAAVPEEKGSLGSILAALVNNVGTDDNTLLWKLDTR